jgi:hypothetical protein
VSLILDPLAGLADMLSPQEADAFDVLAYEPICKPRLDAIERGDDVIPEPCGRCPQEVFHASEDFDIGYGGAVGGGKTKALLMEGIRHAYRWPGMVVGAFRRTKDELAESFGKELVKIDYASALGCRWEAGRWELAFRNGSRIRFRYLETTKQASRRIGGEYQLLLFDQREQLRPEAVSILVDERLRSAEEHIPVIGVRSAANPGDVGHAAFRQRFIEPTHGGLVTYVDDQGRSVRFIPAKVEDNPYLTKNDPGYLRRLDSIPDPRRRKALRLGDWSTFAGQFFSEFRWDRHMVDPFPIPAGWRRWQGVDWGYGHAWAVVWLAVDPEDRVWVYRRLYETGVEDAEQARRILRAEGALVEDFEAEVIKGPDDGPERFLRRQPREVVYSRLADPSMWASRRWAGGQPVATVYAAEGVGLTPALNDRRSGWARIHSYLGDGPACPLHLARGWRTCPRIHFFEGPCTGLGDHIKDAVADPDDPEDIDDDYEPDHDLDGLRYAVMGLPLPHALREPKATPTTPSEDFWSRVRSERRRRGQAFDIDP